jgi:hypothetical protein
VLSLELVFLLFFPFFLLKIFFHKGSSRARNMISYKRFSEHGDGCCILAGVQFADDCPQTKEGQLSCKTKFLIKCLLHLCCEKNCLSRNAKNFINYMKGIVERFRSILHKYCRCVLLLYFGPRIPLAYRKVDSLPLKYANFISITLEDTVNEFKYFSPSTFPHSA